MKFEYKLGPKHEIEIWDLDNPLPDNVPAIYQPHWPDGTPWGNATEAENWAKAFIEIYTNPDYEVVPGPNPDQPIMPRPEPEILEPEVLKADPVDEAKE